MKPTVFLCLLLASSAYGQSRPVGSAATAGLCSPANTGNNNTFTINCGIGKAQGDALLKIVNKILSNQTDLKQFDDKLDEILKSVNEIRRFSGPRHLSDQQKTALLSAMSVFKGERVTISAAMGDTEAYHFAQDFVAVFRSAGFELVAFTSGADKTGVNEEMRAGGEPFSGIYVQPRDEEAWRKPVVQSFLRTLASAQVEYSAQYLPRANTDLFIYVGSKPSD
jgi:hypothetical protein